MSFWRPGLMETKSLFDLLGSLKFVLLKEYRSALIGQSAFFGKSGPVEGPGLELSRVTRQRQAYLVSGFCNETRKEPQGGALLIVSKYDISRKSPNLTITFGCSQRKEKSSFARQNSKWTDVHRLRGMSHEKNAGLGQKPIREFL